MAGLKVPHMGWNQVHQADPSHPMWKDIAQDARFYFVHSYYVEPQDPSIVAATCNYGIDFCTALHKDNLFATQFHPEKSHTAGLQLLKTLWIGISNPIYSKARIMRAFYGLQFKILFLKNNSHPSFLL